MLEPLDVTAGQRYFVAFSKLAGLGLNVVDFGVSLPAPDFNPNRAIDFLGGWYTGADFGTFIEHTFENPAGFAAPILRLHGVIPEPSTAVLALAGLMGRRRLGCPSF